MIKAVLFLILLGILTWALLSLERRCLYYPDRTLIANPRVYRLAYEDVTVRAEDGTQIHAWFIPGNRAQTLLFCHGNAGNISQRMDKALLLHQTGANLLLFDYRGYGQSAGSPSEAGTYQDAEAAYQYLTAVKGMPPAQIIWYGESLGCAVALEMAIRHPGAGLILESPFTSTLAMARRAFPWLPVKWLVRYHYDNLAKIPHLRVPLLWMHSPNDEIVPFEMGRQLFTAAPEPKRLLELRGGHNDGFLESGEDYVKAVSEFLRFIGH